MIEQLRALGLSMGTRYVPYTSTDPETEQKVTTQRYYSWTTDEAKATAAEELGATVITYRSTDPRFSGWEISVAEVLP